MLPGEGLRRLVAANAPYWSGESEVFRTYWSSSLRTRETDALWLLRQAYKEFWDGFVPPLERLAAGFREIDRSLARTAALDLAETLHEELIHYAAFAEVYETLGIEDGRRLDPQRLRERGNWPENEALCRLRAAHKRDHGEIGCRAHAFTEGGYCTLYTEGMRLRGDGGLGERIADACARVYQDEFDHMLHGIAGLDGEDRSDADWALLTRLTVEQMKLRIPMRNAQFSRPLSESRLNELCEGKAEACPFDWARAGFDPPEPGS